MRVEESGQTARDALIERQGKGARYDAPEAPTNDLLMMRRATAVFARTMGKLDDKEMFEPLGHDPSRTQARILAEVGYQARRMALALEPLCSTAAYQVAEAMPENLPAIELAETLPARALRHLFSHSSSHLDVCLRDLPGRYWVEGASVGEDQKASVRELPRQRAKTLVRRARELLPGKSLSIMPAELRDLYTDR